MRSLTGYDAAGGLLLLTLTAPAVNAQVVDSEMELLMASEDWNSLKSIWKLVDGVKPGSDFATFPIASEKGDSLYSVLSGLFEETTIENQQLAAAVSMVRNITQYRVLRLSRLSPLMITRMMPPWTETVQDNLLFSFESRITTLTELINAGEISASEYSSARAALLEKAETIALLDIIKDSIIENRYGQPSSHSMMTDTVSAEIIARLDLSYQAALDTLDSSHPVEYREHYQLTVKEHEEFLQRYENFQAVKPVLRTLLTDLMEVQR